jgi:hypothetical protein
MVADLLAVLVALAVLAMLAPNALTSVMISTLP